MQRLRLSILTGIFALTSGACAITSAASTTTQSQGGVWYTKQPFFGKPRVYYCPPNEATCYRAIIQ